MSTARKPKTIDHYKIFNEIGRGGQARVYEAKDINSEGSPIVALKRYIIDRPINLHRLKQEIKSHVELTKAKVKNIIPVYDYNIDQNGSDNYIVMPIAAHSLWDVHSLFHGRLELTLEIFKQICIGITEVHKKGYVHRDIKPKNILFEHQHLRSVWISDFGICYPLYTEEEDRKTAVDEVVGSRQYMSPEQRLGGVQDITPSADIYSLGKLLHFMLTGKVINREDLKDVFSEDDLKSDWRYFDISGQILEKTIIFESKYRLQDVKNLIKEIELIQKKYMRVKSISHLIKRGKSVYSKRTSKSN